MSLPPVVLDEDTYTEAISLIIERDFFPNLAKLKGQQNVLLQPTITKDQGINFYMENEVELDKRVNLNLSLDQFQTLYTSEDNASFTDLLEKANIKIKQQNKWFFDRESNLRITSAGEEDSTNKLIELNEKAPTGWKYQARNALMYFPEGKSESWINEKESRGAQKSIEYHNTHVASQQINLQPLSTAPAPAPQMTPWSQLQQGISTPGIRGYNLVDATPTLSPSRVGTPQMTWGSIEGTPLLIKGSETPGPQFSLPQISKREQLGIKLSEKASKAYRKKTSQRLGGTPRTGAGLMSPAAQHLLRKSTTTPSKTTGFGNALRSSYGGGGNTTSLFSRKGTPTPIPLFRAGASPAPISGMIRKKK